MLRRKDGKPRHKIRKLREATGARGESLMWCKLRKLHIPMIASHSCYPLSPTTVQEWGIKKGKKIGGKGKNDKLFFAFHLFRIPFPIFVFASLNRTNSSRSFFARYTKRNS